MVVTICKPVNSSRISARYSEKKVDAEKAAIVFSSRLCDPLCPEKTFLLYEKGSKRCAVLSFHASVNPSADDRMTEAKIISMIQELMFGLGYGNQPYIVYRHEDIERAHYHIVSVRVDENGNKIDDSYEYKRCNAIIKKLSKKYGYTVGKKEVSEKKAKSADIPEKKESGNKPGQTNEGVRPCADVSKGFNPKLGNIEAQMKHIAEYAMTFRFDSERQFRLLMRSLNVDVRMGVKSKKHHLVLTGIDPKSGLKSVTPIYLKNDAISTYAVQRHASIMTKLLHDESSIRRVNNTIKNLLPYSMSEAHLVRLLDKYSMSVQFVRSDNGEIIDAMFIDHDARNCIGMEDIKCISIESINNISRTQWMLDIHDNDIRHEFPEMHTDYTEMAIQAMGSEQSRRHEDEEIIRRSKKKHR